MKELEKFYNKITLQECKTEALKYETQREWFKMHELSYRQASDNGWIAKCAGHMAKVSNSFTSKDNAASLDSREILRVGSRAVENRKKKVTNLTLKTTYDTLEQAAASIGRSVSAIKNAAQGKSKSAGGYRWAYTTETVNN